MHPSRIYVLGDPPNYEPSREHSVVGLAEAQRRPTWEVLFDLWHRNLGTA